MPHRWFPLLVGLALVFSVARSVPTAAAADYAVVASSFSATSMHLVLILSLLFVVVLMRIGRRDP